MMSTTARKGFFTEVNLLLQMLAGSAIFAFGLFNVHSQSQITEGGVSGMTLLIQYWLNISPGVSSLVLNTICYAIAFRMLGKTFLKYAMIASCEFTLCYSIFEGIGPILPNMGETPVLAAVVGGLFVGVGVGMIVRCGGASGGDDALALMITKAFKCKLSMSYFITDFVILVLSLSYVPVNKILCSLITVTISSFIIGRIHAGGVKQKLRIAEGVA